MTDTETTLAIGLATLVVERIASHLTRRHQAEAWVRKWFDTLASDLRDRHAKCEKELAEIREILRFIKTDETPAE